MVAGGLAGAGYVGKKMLDNVFEKNKKKDNALGKAMEQLPSQGKKKKKMK